MSEFKFYVSEKDKAILKALAKTIKKTVSPSLGLTLIQNNIALSLGYPSWNRLKDFNKCDVLFTDLPAILKVVIPNTIRSLNIHSNSNKCIDELLAAFSASSAWTQYGGEAPGTIINLCLIPLDKDNYEVISYTSELDLIHGLQTHQSTAHVFNPIVKIDKKLIQRRNRPYGTRRPILKYLELYSDIVFIESQTKICHFNYVPSSAINLSNEELHRVIVRSAFYSPSSYMYKLNLENDFFMVKVYKDSLDNEDNSLAGVIKDDLDSHIRLESHIHDADTYSLIEDTFTLAALSDSFEPRLTLEHSYFDFCRCIIATIYGCTHLPKNLRSVARSLSISGMAGHSN